MSDPKEEHEPEQVDNLLDELRITDPDLYDIIPNPHAPDSFDYDSL